MSISEIEEKITEKGLWANSEIPTSWAWVNFETLFKNISDSNKKLQQKAYQPYGKYPVVDQGKSLISGYIDDESILHPHEPPYIVFGDHTRCVKYINFKFVQGADGIKTLTVSPCSDIKYAFWFLQAIKLPNKGYSRHFQFLKNSDFPLAPLNEQKRIVAKTEELFSKLDAGVVALEKVQANLKRYRAAVLKAAVEGKLTEEWRKQNPNTEPASKLLQGILSDRRQKWESEQLEKYQKSGKTPPQDWRLKYKEPSAPDTANLPSLPDGWCWATADQIISHLRNGLPDKPSDSNLGYPILRINAVRPMTVDLNEVRYLDRKEQDIEDYFVKNGDILFTRYNGSIEFLGVCGMVRGSIQPTLHPDKLIRARTVLEYPLNNFFEIASNVGISRQHIRARARTTAGQTGISGTDIREIPLPLCSLEEQRHILQEIDQRLSLFSSNDIVINNSLKRSSRLRQAILKQAFSGKLVPQDPNDEPASELLQRIQAEKANTIKATPAKRQPKRKVESGQ